MSKTRLVDDCFQASEALMSHDAAITHLKSRTHPVARNEEVPLDRANARILASPTIAKQDTPGHANAAVDGYAYRHADLIARGGDASLEVIGRAAAGRPFSGSMRDGAAVRILTGAVVPTGCDSIVMQEDVSLSDDKRTVTVPAAARAKANVRPAGEDVRRGETLFETGYLLRPQDLAALAAVGHDTLTCFERLRVGIISTGDEVVPTDGTPLSVGQVYDANQPMLNALVTNAGCIAHNLGIWPDTFSEVKTRLHDAAQCCDILITSGGASQGEEDHVAAAIAELGQRHFWRIAVKPGRPLMFGQIEGVPVVGLPGNPVAVFVCFLMYVFPLLRRLGGGPWPEPRRFMLPACFEIAKRKPNRREFWRGTLLQTPDGMVVDKYPKDGSGLISSLRLANGLIDMPEDVPSVKNGDTVAFIPFSEFGILN